jgi:hypothetical protein
MFQRKEFYMASTQHLTKKWRKCFDTGEFLENNLNFVQDVPIIYVNFNITKLIFAEKKNWRDYFYTTPRGNHNFWQTHSRVLVKEKRSHTIKAMLPTSQAQK